MKLLLAIFLCSYVAKASSDKKNFCLKKTNHKTILEELSLKQNLLSFENAAGIFNGGVCWWHNRFQRKAQYLINFKKENPKLSEKKYKKIIRKIIKGKKVIALDGYENLESFSTDFKDYILKRLTLWQVKEGTIGFGWIRGLRGKRKTTAIKLQESMDKLFKYTVREKNISYVKLQLKGIESHSWLVTHMDQTPKGYKIHLIDSNAPAVTLDYHYQLGDTTFKGFRKYGEFLIYLERKREMKKIKKAIKTFCEL